MRKFLGTRLAVILITVLVVSLVSGTAAFAANYNKALPTSGNIVTAVPGLSFYSDSACEVEISSLDWGDVVQGESKQLIVYVKNSGNKDLASINYESDLDANAGSVSFNISSLSLEVGESSLLAITLNANLDGYAGAISPNINFSGTY